MSDCCYSDISVVERHPCGTPTPTPTPTATPTPTPTPTPVPCCLCDSIGIGPFTFHGESSQPSQGWSDLVENCGLTQELLDSTNSKTINCGGQSYVVMWTDSGNMNSFGGKIYDATIEPV